MDRRAFIHLAGLTGVALFAPWGFGSKEASAAETTWGGPYFLHMHASGGWDPTLLCDPKGSETGATNLFSTDSIEQAGNIHYAPIPGNAAFFKSFTPCR